MALRVGSRLGHYEVTAKLGEGGMGQVYRATDTQLNRQVALKILPDAFAHDADRLARFRREAQILASLNHPGIAAIHGIVESPASDAGPAGTRALVLELVEGLTLADRIARGPIPLAEALPIASQIARALEAAHEAGVIHRDLKPSNIKVRADGTVKVLDFGLAKAIAPAEEQSSDATTTSGEGTQPDAALGTAPYMSPEQARGARVDKRTDIWAFGCCVFEMLTGQRAFGGVTRGDILARVFGEEPDWKALPPETPRSVREIMWRCVRKDPKDRLRDVGDARFDVPISDSTPLALAAALRTPRRARPLIAAVAIALAAATLLWLRPWSAPAPNADTPLRRTSVLIRDADAFVDGAMGVVISPDGKTLAFLARSDGRTHIRVRPIDRDESRAVPGTDNAESLFFSPDSRSIGFYASESQEAGALKRVSLDDERVRLVCDTQRIYGGNWGADDTIVYGGTTGLFRVAAGGGDPEPLTTVSVDKGEFSHRYPQILPGGGHVLFTIGTGGDFNSARLAVLDLRTKTYDTVVEGGTAGRYLLSGHLVYALNGTLRVAPFDLSTGRTTGEAIQLTEAIRTDSLLGSAGFSVSTTGTLVYAPFNPRSSQARRVLMLGADGTRRETGVEGLAIQHPRLSPDGKQLAVVVTQGSKNDIWLYNLERAGNPSRLTTEGNNINPVWSTDGQWIYFGSDRGGTFTIYRQRADQRNAERVLESRESQQLPTGATKDGGIVFNRYLLSSNVDIWMLLPGEARETRPILETPFTEGAGTVSPDGRWITYVSNRTGQFEVYVSSFPDVGREVPVSTRGGLEPAWSPLGDRIFYRRDLLMMGVTFPATATTLPGPESLTESILFEGRYTRRNPREYDIARDGGFVVLEDMTPSTTPTELTVVDGWFSELRRLFEVRRN